jgi:hypothetical protein
MPIPIRSAEQSSTLAAVQPDRTRCFQPCWSSVPTRYNDTESDRLLRVVARAPHGPRRPKRGSLRAPQPPQLQNPHSPPRSSRIRRRAVAAKAKGTRRLSGRAAEAAAKPLPKAKAKAKVAKAREHQANSRSNPSSHQFSHNSHTHSHSSSHGSHSNNRPRRPSHPCLPAPRPCSRCLHQDLHQDLRQQRNPRSSGVTSASPQS